MKKENGHAWSVSKDRLIREIKATYDAIMTFQDFEPRTDDELNALSVEQLYEELQQQTSLLDKLVNNWDVRK